MLSDYLFVILILTLANSFTDVSCNTRDGIDTNDVYGKVLENQNPLVPPSWNTSVNITLYLSMIIDINTKSQVMTSRFKMNVFWNDPRLTWSQRQLPELDYVQLPFTKIWTPKIQLTNSVDNNFGDEEWGDVYISPDGQIQWSIDTVAKTMCTIDVTYYPFDQQTCVLKFAPTDSTVYLSTEYNYVFLSQFYPSVMWHMIEAPAYINQYAVPGKSYFDTDVTYYVTIRRMTNWADDVNPLLFVAFISLLPCFVKQTQFLPKLALHLTCLAGIYIHNKNTTEILPATALVIPHSIFFINCLALINMAHVFFTCVLSNFNQELLKKWFPGKSNITKNKNTENGDVEIQEAEAESEVPRTTTTNVLVIVDRIISLLVLVSVIVATAHFLNATPYPHNRKKWDPAPQLA